MIAEFNSYMSNIDIDFFKELCLKHGELRHYKKNEFILHEGDACSFFGFILSGYNVAKDLDYNKDYIKHLLENDIVSAYYFQRGPIPHNHGKDRFDVI